MVSLVIFLGEARTYLIYYYKLAMADFGLPYELVHICFILSFVVILDFMYLFQFLLHTRCNGQAVTCFQRGLFSSFGLCNRNVCSFQLLSDIGAVRFVIIVWFGACIKVLMFYSGEHGFLYPPVVSWF